MTDALTIPAVLERRVRQSPDSAAIAYKADGKTFSTISYREVWERCVRTHAGLHALGLKPGGWIVMIGDGSGPVAVRFWSVILGVYRLGSAVACLGGRRLDELMETIERCEPAALVTENEKTYGLALQACAELAKAGKPPVRIIRAETDPKPADGAPAGAAPVPTDHLDDMLAAGDKALASGEVAREGAGPAKPDDNCLILLTSGSTGKRKAVPLTHANFYHSYMPAVSRVTVGPTDCLLQYMPASHVLSHDLTYAVFSVGARLAYTSADARLINDIAPSGATIVPGPPRLGMVIMNTAEFEIKRKGRLAERLYNWAQAGTRAWQGWPAFLGAIGLPAHGLGKLLFYPKIRAKLGSVRLMVFGSAPLPLDVQKWFFSIGIPAINGYGLTEAPIVAASDPLKSRPLGSVGTPLPGVDVKFVDERGRDTDDDGKPLKSGNLCLRGGAVLAGYYRDEAATAESLSNGWFITGDQARMDSRGELTIEGRLKDIVVPVSGENLAPIPVENAIARCPYVDQVVVVGDGCKSIGAIIVPNFERLRGWAKDNGVSEADAADGAKLVADAKVRGMMTKAVKSLTDKMDALVAHGGAISRIELLADPFSVENGLLTPDIRKIRRRAVNERYAELIGKMCG